MVSGTTEPVVLDAVVKVAEVVVLVQVSYRPAIERECEVRGNGAKSGNGNGNAGHTDKELLLRVVEASLALLQERRCECL